MMNLIEKATIIHCHRHRITAYGYRTIRALLYNHSRLNTNTAKTLENAWFLNALIELLSEKGIIAIEELDAQSRVVSSIAGKISGSGWILKGRYPNPAVRRPDWLEYVTRESEEARKPLD